MQRQQWLRAIRDWTTVISPHCFISDCSKCPAPNAPSRDTTGAGSIEQPLCIFSTAMDSAFLKSSLQRSINFMGFVLVIMSLAIAAPATERSLSGPSRALRPQELVVTSNLTTPTGDSDSLSYLPRILPLPAGESPVKVFLVTPSDEWRELTQLTLRVKAAAPDSASPGQTGGQTQAAEANAAQTGAAKKYSFAP